MLNCKIGNMIIYEKELNRDFNLFMEIYYGNTIIKYVGLEI